MITQELWRDFIRSFFKIDNMSDDWFEHIVRNWNPLRNESGCDCQYFWATDPIVCEGYKSYVEHKVPISEADDVSVFDDEPLGHNSELY